MQTAKPEVMRNWLPTVPFDASRVDAEVRKHIAAKVAEASGARGATLVGLIEAAITAVSRGRDLAHLTNAIRAADVPEQKRRDAGVIALRVCNSATSLMNRKQQAASGIETAIWMHSGAGCGGPDMDAAHSKVSGKSYPVEKGMPFGWTRRRSWPGWDDGCKCFSKPIVPGFS
jgi:hypothetical protein